MEMTPSKTKQYIKEALKDDHLRMAVDKATQTALHKREDKVDQIPYWEDLRLEAYAVKKDVIEHLDQYLEEFEKNCQENGIHVHWAADTEEAQKIIFDLAKEKKVKTIVKSKSLTTEEIHLNKFLIGKGIETLETDLG
ncbi:MAG: hypothetical protein GWP06_03105, partial [Actinobacteria bacterium]|nr:hypothetical protein [Actinomycetota bacterium]